jgi:hypothetical protein
VERALCIRHNYYRAETREIEKREKQVFFFAVCFPGEKEKKKINNNNNYKKKKKRKEKKKTFVDI